MCFQILHHTVENMLCQKIKLQNDASEKLIVEGNLFYKKLNI